MTVEIRVPTLGESVTEAIIGKWLKKPGEPVQLDEPIVELETDKVAVEVNAPAAGVISEQLVKEGDTVAVGALLGSVDPNGKGAAAPAPAAAKPAETPKAAPAAPAAAPASGKESGPAVNKLVAETGVNPAAVPATGKDGRLTKGDVLQALSQPAAPAVAELPAPPAGPRAKADREERVRMTSLRKTMRGGWKESQNSAAMLTTFNEVDMSAVMALREQYKESFEKKHGVKLGFMGFFVKACVHALQEIPAVNAEIAGDEIIYKNYYDIGVAVSSPAGLVVPVIRDTEAKGFAQIEKDIGDYGKKARDGKLAMADLTGGTFTISNGGIFGSLMSTPILNAPQSGILGMHKIQERPVVEKGQLVIRPMMYLALSYDHRIVDGREAVTFLVRVKECIEDPQRLLLDV